MTLGIVDPNGRDAGEESIGLCAACLADLGHKLAPSPALVWTPEARGVVPQHIRDHHRIARQGGPGIVEARTRAEEAWRLHEEAGMGWEEIGERLHYADSRGARRSAERHRDRALLARLAG